VVFALAFLLRKPSTTAPIQRKSLRLPQTKVDRSPREAVRTPVFWVMYAMFVMVASGGLMAAAQIAPIAHDFQVAGVPVNLFGLQMAALTLAISLDRIFDGFGLPFFGFVSDNIGRENTMFIAFSTAALAVIVLLTYGHNPMVFVLATAVYFGVFGEIYSLFPATCGDTFGSKYAASNAGLLYTAKGTAAFLVPFASILSATYGWSAVFTLIIVLNVTAAALAMFVLRPMRARYLADAEQPATLAAQPMRAGRPVSAA
jgi:OFA family oxalate/formate antiporter-like MFS transporter